MIENISTCFQPLEPFVRFYIFHQISKLVTLEVKHDKHQAKSGNDENILLFKNLIYANTKLLSRATKDKQKVNVVENGAGCPDAVCSYNAFSLLWMLLALYSLLIRELLICNFLHRGKGREGNFAAVAHNWAWSRPPPQEVSVSDRSRRLRLASYMKVGWTSTIGINVKPLW